MWRHCEGIKFDVFAEAVTSLQQFFGTFYPTDDMFAN